MNENIADLYSRARTRTQAAEVVDANQAAFQSRLGNLEEQVSNYSLPPAEGIAHRKFLVESHTAWLRTIADAPESQLGSLLYPLEPSVEMSRRERAMQMIDHVRNAGVILSSPRKDVVEAAPCYKLDQIMRDAVADLVPEISALLRAEIETFAAAA